MADPKLDPVVSNYMKSADRSGFQALGDKINMAIDKVTDAISRSNNSNTTPQNSNHKASSSGPAMGSGPGIIGH